MKLIIFTFDQRYILLYLQIGVSFVKAAVVCTIFERTLSFGTSPETTAPRYLKLVTVPSFVFHLDWPCLSSVWSSKHRSRSYTMYRFCRASNSCSFSAKASMSWANRRLVINLPPMLTFPSCSFRASDIICWRKCLRRLSDRRYPCLTQIIVLNHSPSMLQFI